jgi:hypothetical protein
MYTDWHCIRYAQYMKVFASAVVAAVYEAYRLVTS